MDVRHASHAPQCRHGHQRDTIAAPASDLFVGGFGSCHPAGSNFLFGDRAVRFVDRAIDAEVYRRLANRADGKLLESGPTREN